MRRVFLVICEGETEKAYIEALKREYRLPITIKTKVSGQSINERVVKHYLRELDLEKNDDCEIFYIYDGDVENVTEKLKILPGTMILTNPCIELWFLLHLKMCTRVHTSESIVKSLITAHPSWSNYSKGLLSKDQIGHLTVFRSEAMSRASKLHWPANPSSNFAAFIQKLETEKNL